VAFCNVHSVMTARKDLDVARALDQASVTAPDGMPVAWGLRAVGFPDQQRVAGPTFTESALRYGVEVGWKHFFYGSTPDTLARLGKRLEELAPGIQIAGVFSPPFRPPTDTDIQAAADMIIRSGADLVWVGLGMPKQELWMARAQSHLPGVGVLGVGAAFDFLAGTSARAPMWMQKTGLEWLHRFGQQPGRLWRRYLINNPTYLWLLGLQLVRARLGRGRPSGSR
jgi:N-acetylglucosaminyldiphosphoundecaprenol N-acetyl-beta-D-mannosaminyltransferase